MGGLFSSPKYPDPEPPAPMPDAEDPLAKRKRARTGGIQTAPSSTQDKLAPVPGTIGREYTRQTLGGA